jgi:hypothetical protein
MVLLLLSSGSIFFLLLFLAALIRETRPQRAFTAVEVREVRPPANEEPGRCYRHAA